jgi:RNA polymerase sigma-70 factor (ECF subfamily)
MIEEIDTFRLYAIGRSESILVSERGGAEASDSGELTAANRAMERYADGDDGAFATVFEVIGPRLLRYLRRLSGSDDRARDLLQEALLRLHQARGAFREGSAVLPWSYTIARNVFLDAQRARKRAATAFAARDPDHADEPSAAAEAESAVVAKETARAVERALASMSEARREAFILIRSEGLSVADAAEVVGVSENAVKLRAFQAYELIRAELERAELAARVRKP